LHIGKYHKVASQKKIFSFSGALDDFDKIATKDESSSAVAKKSDDDVEDPPMETLWNDEFIAQQAKFFEKQMADIFGAGDKEVTPEQINLGFQRIAEAAAMAVDPNSGAQQAPQVDPAFTQSISDVLKGLSEGQENLQQPFSQDDIAGMFGNINLNESGENNAFLPFMQGMMQSLLSAEVLLPSLKEIVSKYPAWLTENGSKISVEEKERYENQLRLMQEVCGELEKENANDSSDVKKDRFNIVLDRMQKMQELGQPPADLVGEGAENVIPNLEGMPNGEQCSLM
jgi:peroxin-19